MTFSIDEPARSRLPIHVLRNRDYRLLWAGQFVSTLGTQMHAVALSWQVWDLTGSFVQLGLLGLVRAAALMATSFVGGATADARNRRTLMLITQSMLLFLSGSLAALTAANQVNVILLYVIAALVASTTAFDGPARQGRCFALGARNGRPKARRIPERHYRRTGWAAPRDGLRRHSLYARGASGGLARTGRIALSPR